MATLRQVEKFTVSMLSTDLSKTHTLSTTLLDKDTAFMVFGIRNDSAAPPSVQVTGEITNTTTLTFQKGGTADAVEVVGYVAEFTAGVSVDHFTGAVSGSGEDNLTLVNVTNLSKAFVFHSIRVGSGSAFSPDDIFTSRLWDDGGTLKCNLKSSDTSVSNTNYSVMVVQYDDCSVQRGSVTTMGTTDTSKTATITSVDTDKAFLNFSHRANFTDYSDIGQHMLRGRITSATELTFDRDHHGGLAIDDIRWEVIEFTDSVTVQTVSEAFANGDGQEDATITAVSGLNAAIALASCIQKGGSTSFSTNDIPGHAWFTAELTTTTNLQTKREPTGSTADAEFYVIDFGATGAITFQADISGATVTSSIDLGGVAILFSASVTAATVTSAVDMTLGTGILSGQMTEADGTEIDCSGATAGHVTILEISTYTNVDDSAITTADGTWEISGLTPSTEYLVVESFADDPSGNCTKIAGAYFDTST